MTFHLYLNNEILDISNDVILNSYTYTTRIDDVFGSGNFIFESENIKYNIPPYSKIIINNELYLCSSESTYHFGVKKYIHNVSLIEATSILSRFVIGSKAFSVTGTNKFDYNKVGILFNLVKEKYGFTITADTTSLNNLNKEIEYVFSAGTTLFDALNEILRNYNYKAKVTGVDYENKTITLTFIDLSAMSSLSENVDKLLSQTYLQNADNYFKTLESEVDNVIDLTTTLSAKYLSARSREVRISDDTAVLELPTPVYKVSKFEINDIPITSSKITLVLEGDFQKEDVYYTFTESYKTFAEQYPTTIGKLYDEFFVKYGVDKTVLEGMTWQLYVASTTTCRFTPYPNPTSNLIKITYDISNKILSKEKWDLLEEKEKPRYCYYTNGSNLIEGFNTYYKNDFWNSIIGADVNSFLDNLPINYYQDLSNTTIWLSFGEVLLQEFINSRSSDYTVGRLNNTFNVEYYPIANPLLKISKEATPINENEFKNYALTFNKSSNFVDYKKITNAMKLTAESVGEIEIVREYDATDLTIVAGQKMTIDGYNYYISNIVTTFRNNQEIATINLVRNYNKQADVIGVDTQYNTLKNPYESVIERPIYFSFSDVVLPVIENIYFLIEVNSTKLIKPAVVFKEGDKYTFYCSAVDNYCFGKKAVKYSAGDIALRDVAYCDENNELSSITVKLVKIYQKLSIEESLILPEYEGEYSVIVSFTQAIYKDAREKLTFTIQYF